LQYLFCNFVSHVIQKQTAIIMNYQNEKYVDVQSANNWAVFPH